jgi:hypothetical protein
MGSAGAGRRGGKAHTADAGAGTGFAGKARVDNSGRKCNDRKAQHPDITVSDIVLLSAELEMIRDGESEPLPE